MRSVINAISNNLSQISHVNYECNRILTKINRNYITLSHLNSKNGYLYFLYEFLTLESH